jgi:hypothetical protein
MACARDKDNPVDAVKGAADSAVAAAKDPALQGKVFESDCSIQPLMALVTVLKAKSSKTQYTFKGNSIVKHTLIYPTTNCAGDVMASFEEDGTVDIKDSQKTQDGARFIDINYTNVKGVINSDAGANLANTVRACGFSDWSRGKERDVTATSKNVNCYGTAVPRNDYNVYRLEGTSLIFGEGSGHEDENSRPTTLSRDQKFISGRSGSGPANFYDNSFEQE